MLKDEQLPCLVLDASAGSIFVGILGSELRWLAHQQSEANALESLFPSVDACLQQADCPLESIRSFVYCEGPGSVLGLRLCAMAIETWRRLSANPCPLYSYNSLTFAAHLALQDHAAIARNSMLVSDWKKGVWHAIKIKDGQPQMAQPLSNEQLSQVNGPLFHLPQRKGWQSPPEGAITIEYQPERLVQLIESADLLSATESVELFSAGANTFQKWTPDRHRLTQ